MTLVVVPEKMATNGSFYTTVITPPPKKNKNKNVRRLVSRETDPLAGHDCLQAMLLLTGCCGLTAHSIMLISLLITVVSIRRSNTRRFVSGVVCACFFSPFFLAPKN